MSHPTSENTFGIWVQCAHSRDSYCKVYVSTHNGVANQAMMDSRDAMFIINTYIRAPFGQIVTSTINGIRLAMASIKL